MATGLIALASVTMHLQPWFS